MSRISPLHFVNASLVFGLLLAVTDAVAQTQSPAGGGGGGGGTTSQLVNTACEQGHINKCGQRSLGETCTWTMHVDLSAVQRSGGFTFGTQTCVSKGYIDLYKDFESENRTGGCYVLPRTPWDGSGWGRRGDEDGDDSEESC